MSRLLKKRSKTIGLPPGSLIHVGENKAEEVKITVIDYDEKSFEVYLGRCSPADVEHRKHYSI